jgi:hypothetical protein
MFNIFVKDDYFVNLQDVVAFARSCDYGMSGKTTGVIWDNLIGHFEKITQSSLRPISNTGQFHNSPKEGGTTCEWMAVIFLENSEGLHIGKTHIEGCANRLVMVKGPIEEYSIKSRLYQLVVFSPLDIIDTPEFQLGGKHIQKILMRSQNGTGGEGIRLRAVVGPKQPWTNQKYI